MISEFLTLYASICVICITCDTYSYLFLFKMRTYIVCIHKYIPGSNKVYNCIYLVKINLWENESHYKIFVSFVGGSSIAPGQDVNVLFPGESQIIGSQAGNTAPSGQKSKFSCQYCNLPMNVGDVAIFCERAGQDKVWALCAIFWSRSVNIGILI